MRVDDFDVGYAAADVALDPLRGGDGVLFGVDGCSRVDCDGALSDSVKNGQYVLLKWFRAWHCVLKVWLCIVVY